MATIELDSKGLAQLVSDLGQFVRNDFALRAVQARNAPQCAILAPMTLAAGGVSRIPEAQGADEFAFMQFVVETTSGAARYDPGTGQPATASRGLEVPAGGTIISLEGATNIRQFSICAVGALNITYALFK